MGMIVKKREKTAQDDSFLGADLWWSFFWVNGSKLVMTTRIVWKGKVNVYRKARTAREKRA